MELLTGPSLLILDEPTSGLDPALDRQVMSDAAPARRRRPRGRRRHTFADLPGACATRCCCWHPAARPPTSGPPAGIGPAMGTTDWADIFARVSLTPTAGTVRFWPIPPAARRAAATTGAAPGRRQPAHTSLWRQMCDGRPPPGPADRRRPRLLHLPGAAAVRARVLSLVVPGNVGLGPADPRGKTPTNPPRS